MPASAAFALVVFGCLTPLGVPLLIWLHDAGGRVLNQLEQDLTLMLGCWLLWSFFG
jgi:hypothetical protein